LVSGYEKDFEELIRSGMIDKIFNEALGMCSLYPEEVEKDSIKIRCMGFVVCARKTANLPLFATHTF
jgi:hypothetical protein